MPVSKPDLVRAVFDAYRTGERQALDDALSEDFTFTSPYDDAIDKAEYFRRCWPNRDLIERHEIERIVEGGDGAFVTYLCRTRDGKEFRNTEFFTFAGDRVRSVDVYFGAAYRDGVFQKSA
ncbi:nuclear transport factor 2 family protein [Bosea sp. (in: a-proteobacteria)]|jgi:ketosteroid isomerase-like protein|uniref:nuclear transport factor 2 family protein n=1 Tax=Bosea sp. (in: a-proteobacteria) TaxID=1871050 RepID=UPI003F707777